MSESEHTTSSFAYHTGRILGKYQLLSLIDRGGMAEVYKSFHPDLERDLAIKILYPHFTDYPGFIERFRREARAAAGLRHPHIVQIFDFDRSEDGLYYMVLEYIEGQSLEQFLKAQAPLTLPQALTLFRQIASATQYAHEHGLIHRDIKPANVLLDNRGQAYLTDFGIAQIVELTRLTQTDSTAGTPVYMAPEQIEGQMVTVAADVYSLGMLLYKMLTNRLPYESDNSTLLLMQKMTEPPVPPRRFKPDLPLAVERVLLQALAHEPGDRFLDVVSMTWALEEAYGAVPEGDLADTAVGPPPSATLEMPLNRLDHYEIREQLPASETSLSRRFVAHNQMLAKPVLLELLKSEAKLDGERFVRRMTAVSQLDHPFIPAVTFINQSLDGFWYAALDYKPGMTLAAYLQREPQDEATRQRLMGQCGEALLALHAANLAHGELLPETVYVGEDGQVWLLGLGAALAEPTVADDGAAFGRLCALLLPGVLGGNGVYDSITAVLDALDPAITKPRFVWQRRWFWPVVAVVLVVGVLVAGARLRGRTEPLGDVTAVATAAVVGEVVVGEAAVASTPVSLPTATAAESRPAAAVETTTSPIRLVAITYNPAGEDAEGEVVVIANSGDEPVVLTDWQLQDDAQRAHIFTFPPFTLAAGAQVKVWTGRGADSAEELYWRSGAAIWNNEGDVARLFDGLGQLVAECVYEGGEETAVCPVAVED
ncbi:MAG: protein kinase [Ardenticatenaceae bacterium]|nr:protein kinase [Ardenticatenaceae bacterium]